MARNLTLIAILSAGAALLSVPAQAGEFAFSYKAYELETAQGRENVYERLGRVAKNHCRQNAPWQLYSAKLRRACVGELVDEVVAQIGDGELMAMHRNEMSLAAR